MNIWDMAYQICKYLPTSYESKKHGGWKIYEDDKIYIAYDTYYPNLDIYVKAQGGKKHPMLLRSGDGRNQEYHPGAWEDYIKKIYEDVPAAREEKEQKEAEQKIQEHEARFGAASDDLNKVFYKTE